MKKLLMIAALGVASFAPAYAQDLYCAPTLEMQEEMSSVGFTPIFVGLSDEYPGGALVIYTNLEMFMVHAIMDDLECHIDSGTEWAWQPPGSPS